MILRVNIIYSGYPRTLQLKVRLESQGFRSRYVCRCMYGDIYFLDKPTTSGANCRERSVACGLEAQFDANQ